MKGRVVAVCGKGGVGKTTVCALLAKTLSQMPDMKCLLVDADHAGGLSMALGLTPERSINDLRKDLIEEIQEQRSDRKDLAAHLDYLLMDVATEKGNMAFFSMGRPDEKGCFCTVNTLLKEAIETLASRFDLTVIDAEAGIEQVNRDVMSSVDTLLLVSDTSAKAIKVAHAIADVAGKANPECKPQFLLNRIMDEEEVVGIEQKISIPLAGYLMEDKTVRKFDSEEISFFEIQDCRALEKAKEIFKNAKII